MPQEFVGPPVPRQFHRRPAQVAVILLQLGFEAAEQSKCVGRRPGKTRDNLVVIKPPDFLGRMLDHRFAKRDLAVPGQNHLAVAANR